jgi:hypothetical protein
MAPSAWRSGTALGAYTITSMNDEDAIQYLNTLPDERLVAILRRVFAVKQPASQEAAYCRNRFYLGTAWSDLESGESEPQRWGPWELEAVAYVDAFEQGDDLGPDYGLCQSGSCLACGTRVRSNVKHGLCPICDGQVYMT